MLHDFANDDDFGSGWVSNAAIQRPHIDIMLDSISSFNAITITESPSCNLKEYTLQYRDNTGNWRDIYTGESPTARRVKIHRFDPVVGDRVRLVIDKANSHIAINEIGVYAENR